MSHRALYYPEWGVPNATFLFEALLYWNSLTCIIPFEDFVPHAAWSREVRREMAALHESYVHGWVPSEDERREVHRRMQWFAESDPPAWCRPENLQPSHAAVMSAYKFDPKTIRLLQQRGWAREVADDPRRLQMMSDAAANLFMATLAQVCSSHAMPPLTNDPGSYVAGCNRLLAELGARTGLATRARRDRRAESDTHRTTDGPDEAEFVLASIRRLALGRQVTVRDLRRLHDLRSKDDYNGLREAFCDRIDRYLEETRRATGAERAAVAADFENEFKRDRRALRRDLRLAGLDVLVNKETLVGILTGGGVQAAGVLAGHPTAAIGIGVATAAGGLVHGLRRRREEIVDDHWSSWLFAVQRRPRIALF
jgi:hypothetical protein